MVQLVRDEESFEKEAYNLLLSIHVQWFKVKKTELDKLFPILLGHLYAKNDIFSDQFSEKEAWSSKERLTKSDDFRQY